MTGARVQNAGIVKGPPLHPAGPDSSRLTRSWSVPVESAPLSTGL